MSYFVLALFCAALAVCIGIGISILWALAFGLFLFMAYGRWKGFSARSLVGMALRGALTVKNILLVFVLIGMLTAFWRASGTIAFIVCYAAGWVSPSLFLLMAFLLNCLVSFLTGTSFGTAATMGVICAAMGRTLGVDMTPLGGAVVAGAFFGDRWSPVSTSASLVAQVTGTDLFRNLHNMFRSALVPFFASCVLYAILGWMAGYSGDLPDLFALFQGGFVLHPVEILPAAVLLALALLHVDVKLAMGAGILTALPFCLAVQHMTWTGLLATAVSGYHAADPAVAAMMDGGGILSMLEVGGIVCLSSSYSEIFQKTGLLDGVKTGIKKLAAKTTVFTAVLASALFTEMIACNQTLPSILVSQLCGGLYKDRYDLALALEDTVIVTAALIPWSIAAAVPLSSIGAPDRALACAFFLYLLPLWRLGQSFYEKRKAGQK